MVTSAKTRQYQEVVRYITNHPYCSQKEIIAHLEELHLGMSQRTFERMKNELIDIGYEMIYHHGQGYTIEHDESPYFKDMDEFIHLINSFGYMADSLKDLQLFRKHIRMTESSTLGQENLPTLLEACIDHSVVSFDHLNYQTNEVTSKSIEPYQIRENQGRWYVIGVERGLSPKSLRAYGVDRVKNLAKTNRIFKTLKKLDPDRYYEHVVGVWSKEGEEPVTVILEVDSANWKWINSLPWHASQEFISEKDDIVQFSIYVKLTLDLQRKIMEWAPKVKVVSPSKLQKQIVGVYQKGLRAYN